MKVFISYRRSDKKSFVVQLQQFLTTALHLEVTMDVKIPAGEDWHPYIHKAIQDCDAFIAVIGPKWERGRGTRNIRNKADIVRGEIEEALSAPHVRLIIPLLVGRKKIDRKKLPKAIHGLLKRQYLLWPRDLLLPKIVAKHGAMGDLVARLRDCYSTLQPKPIAVLSSTIAFLGDGESTEGLDYFATLIMTITQRLRELGHQVVLMVPTYGDSRATVRTGESQQRLLREFTANYTKYSGLIVAPFETKSLQNDLVTLLRKDRNYPVATIDKVYFDNDRFFQKMRVNPPAGCACDGEGNGRLAASSIIKYVEHAKISRPTVVVLQGLEGSAERIAGFIKAINEYNSAANLPEDNQIQIAVSGQYKFLRKEAREAAEAYMAEHGDWSSLNDQEFMAMVSKPATEFPGNIDAFFCCNDEMALGVWDFLFRKWIESGAKIVDKTVIVGFDGIAEVRRKIDEGDFWLLNTVDVKARAQVGKLINAFEVALKDHKRVRGLTLEPGELLLRDQTKHVEEMLRVRKGKLDWVTSEEMRYHAPSIRNPSGPVEPSGS